MRQCGGAVHMIGWWSGEDSEGSDIVDTVRNDDVFDIVSCCPFSEIVISGCESIFYLIRGLKYFKTSSVWHNPRAESNRMIRPLLLATASTILRFFSRRRWRQIVRFSLPLPHTHTSLHITTSHPSLLFPFRYAGPFRNARWPCPIQDS